MVFGVLLTVLPGGLLIELRDVLITALLNILQIV